MTEALRWLLGLTFAAAGVAKIADPAAFAASIAQTGLTPMATVPPLAILLPWIEVIAAAALLFLPSYREAAIALILTLLIAFTGFLGVGLVSGIDVPCGCFGASAEFLNNPVFVMPRNALLAAIAVVLFIRVESRPARRREGIQAPSALSPPG